MKLIVLRLGGANKSSPISKGVMEIRINSQPSKGINRTIGHTQATRAPPVAIVQDAVKESGRVLPHPSAILNVYALADTLCKARTLSHCTPVKRGMVSSNSSTHKASQFGFSICLVYAST
jgi:hypothetical protein